MNIVQKSIFNDTKLNQKKINKFKIIISSILLFLFFVYYITSWFIWLYYISIFLILYILVALIMRYYYDSIYNYYKYLNTALDIIWVLILVKIITDYSFGLYISMYFIPFLLTIIVISWLSFQLFYTAVFWLFSIIVSTYLLYFDRLLDIYALFILFFIITIYLSSIYSVINLRRVVKNVSNLKQLEKFTDSILLKEIENNPLILNQEWKQKELVIMFLDIKWFSKLSEKIEADKIFSILNRYLWNFSKIIEDTGGNVDKYIWDCVMSYFSWEDMAKNAYKASEKILKILKDLNKDSKVKIWIWIWLHFWIVYAGWLWNENRMDYTIIWDNVNIASRLELMTRKLNTNVAASKDYFMKLDFKNNLKFSWNHFLKWKDNSIDIYTM